MASLTRWMWVWVNSGRWLWTGRPGVLRFVGSQRVGHDWGTELNWTVYRHLAYLTYTQSTSAYLRFLIFLPAILISACASSSLAFCMMYSVYKLNKQGDNIQPWCTPFPIWNQLNVPWLVLTVASWPAYRFLRRQVRWSGILVSLKYLHLIYMYLLFSFYGEQASATILAKEWASELLGRLLKQSYMANPRISDLVNLGWTLGILICNKFPGHAQE